MISLHCRSPPYTGLSIGCPIMHCPAHPFITLDTHHGVLLRKKSAPENCRTSPSPLFSACSRHLVVTAKGMWRRLQSRTLFEGSCLGNKGNLIQQISFGAYMEVA